jgi:hypothetical protein
MHTRASFPRGLGLALPLILAAGCRLPDNGLGRASEAGEPLRLEKLQVGSVYGVGSQFKSDGLAFTVSEFDGASGNVEVAQAVAPPAATPSRPGEKAVDRPPGRALRLAHATLGFSGRKVESLEFEYADRGGPVSLALGDASRRAEDWIELDGQDLGGARVSVRESSIAGVRHGHVLVTSSAPIGRFALGGAELDVSALRLLVP